jgi:hypothetical protein
VPKSNNDPKAERAARTAEARQHYLEGQRLYDLRRYPDAIPEFETAYRLTGDPALLYNIGQAFRLSNRYPDALHYYKTYLKKVPGSALRVEVERRIAELERVDAPPNQTEPPFGTEPGPVAPTLSAANGTSTTGGYGVQPAAADPAPIEVQGRSIRRGLYLSAFLGPAYLSTTSTMGGTDVSIEGSAGVVGIDVGWALNSNWVVFGALYAASASDPEVKYGTLTLMTDAVASVGGLGAGLRYFFVPSHFHLGGALLAIGGELTSSSGSSETKVGSALLLSGGKQWWVGSRLSIGVNVQLMAGVLPDADDVTWSTAGFGIAFVGMYN